MKDYIYHMIYNEKPFCYRISKSLMKFIMSKASKMSKERRDVIKHLEF